MNTTVPSINQFDVYESVTTTIITSIERGAGTFVMPWHRTGSDISRPANVATGAAYRGVNVIALWAQALSAGFQSSHWGTYRQWAVLNAQVRRGERGSPILFYKPARAKDQNPDDEQRKRFLVRASWVFNAEQVEGWIAPVPVCVSEPERVEAAEALVASTGASVLHGGDQAYYTPGQDEIHLPLRSQFLASPTRTNTEAYYAVMLHELVHWSGASHRLNRTFGSRFGDQAYAAEELVAELGAAFLCADLGISNDPRPDHAAYVADWLAVLGSDKRAIVTASRLAAEAASFLMMDRD